MPESTKIVKCRGSVKRPFAEFSRNQVGAGRALEERLARCERLFELAVAPQGLAVDQAHFGLLVTFELLHERLDQVAGRRRSCGPRPGWGCSSSRWW